MHGCLLLNPEMEMLIMQLFIRFALGLEFKHLFFLLLSQFLAALFKAREDDERHQESRQDCPTKLCINTNEHGFGRIRVPKQKGNTDTKEMEVFLFR
ncbi:hypothetical protein Tco_1553682 [Tanacetum coccineum]